MFTLTSQSSCKIINMYFISKSIKNLHKNRRSISQSKYSYVSIFLQLCKFWSFALLKQHTKPFRKWNSFTFIDVTFCSK